MTWARLERVRKWGGLDGVEVDPKDENGAEDAPNCGGGPAQDGEEVDGDYEPPSVKLAVEEGTYITDILYNSC